MDQIKIGKFIAERRRAAGLTQMQLAEMLSITDRAVSKWENGKSLPDSSIMLALCKILKITVNDLLSGEVISMDNYNEEIEKNLINMVREKENRDKMLLLIEWGIGILSLAVLLIPIFIAAFAPIEEEWIRTVIVFSGFIPALAGFFLALKIEQIAGYYECKLCGHKYVPTFKAVSFAQHVGRTRYLKCPKCGKRSWQKKVINKDN